MNSRNKKILVVAIIVVFVASALFSYGGFFYSNSYTTAYQGAKASFYGISWNGQQISLGADTTFTYKGDTSDVGLPRLNGEMTSVFIPSATSQVNLPNPIPQNWASDLAYINNPQKTYTFDVKQGTTTTHYSMEQWVTKWYISISAGSLSGLNFWNGITDNTRHTYQNMEIWMKLDTTPSWYFQGADTTYFAIAQVMASQVDRQGHVVSQVDVTPENPSTTVTCYTQPYGNKASPSTSQFAGYSSQGNLLNPQYFGNAVYVHINLNDFGLRSWYDGLTYKTQGDVVSYEFTVTQFVVGKWTVQDIEQTPQNYERASPVTENGLSSLTNALNGIGQWLSNPINLMIVVVVGIIIAVIVISLIVPMAAHSKSKAVKIIGLLLVAVAILAIISWVLGII